MGRVDGRSSPSLAVGVLVLGLGALPMVHPLVVPQNPLAYREEPSEEGPLPDSNEHPEFYFTRAAYNGYRGRSWSVDFPKADRQFLIGLRRLTRLEASGRENPVRLDDPALSRFPFLYAVEVG